MKKIIKKLAIGTFFLVIFVLGGVLPQYSMGYMAAFQDKLHYAESIEEPKIILMGDSNLAFGIDSEKIEQEIGMPVVNMGLHGGLGQTFCMDLAKHTIEQGDIVVVLPAYYGYSVGLADGTLGWTLLENNFSLWTKVSVRDYPVLWRTFPTYLQKTITLFKTSKRNTVTTGGYSRLAFNKYGDIESTGSENVMPEGYLPGEPWSVVVNGELIDYYNDYHAYVQDKGAVMIAACPPLIDSSEQINAETFEKTYEVIISGLNFDFISDWEDYIYPMEYFYDTNYHLNDVGRVYRTEQLIEDIYGWLQN